MNDNIFEWLKNQFSGSTVSSLAGLIGENEASTGTAVNTGIAAILSSLSHRAGQPGGTGFVQQLIDSFSSGNTSPLSMLSGNPQALEQQGSGMLSSLFGNNQGQVMQAIAQHSGINVANTSRLMTLVAPLLATFVGQFMKNNNMGVAGLISSITASSPSFSNLLPSGISSLLQAGGPTHHVPQPPVMNDTGNSRGNGWMWPLLVLIGLAALVFYLMKCRNTPTEPVTTPVADTIQTSTPVTEKPSIKGTMDTSGNFIYETGELTKFSLPGGVEIEAGRNSSEYRLYQFLSDGTMMVDSVDKTKGWITLDRLYFETGKASITEASMMQLRNIAAILKAYPDAQVKMGGYTDNTGAADMNKKLSDERAAAAAKSLVKMGIAASRVKSEGYGQDHPACPANDTPECKAQNRRIDVRVTKK